MNRKILITLTLDSEDYDAIRDTVAMSAPGFRDALKRAEELDMAELAEYYRGNIRAQERAQDALREAWTKGLDTMRFADLEVA